MPNQIIKAVKEGFEEIGSEVKDQVSEATVGVVKNIPQQIFGGQNNSDGQKPIEPPDDQEVIEHLYGATGKPKKTPQQLKRQADKSAIIAIKKAQRIRQNLRALMESPMASELTAAREMEERKQAEIASHEENQPPALIEPGAAPKKGMFGMFGSKSRKKTQAVSDLQTSIEKRMPGSGIA